MVGGPTGLSLGGDLGLYCDFAFGEGACGPPNPLKEPKDPDSLFEKLPLLLLFAEDLLDAVD